MENEECTHDCSSCGSNCASKKESLIEPCNAHSKIKRVIGVVSGKGGVGKSMVTASLANLLAESQVSISTGSGMLNQLMLSLAFVVAASIMHYGIRL